jgi:hypothetical protein
MAIRTRYRGNCSEMDSINKATSGMVSTHVSDWGIGWRDQKGKKRQGTTKNRRRDERIIIDYICRGLWTRGYYDHDLLASSVTKRRLSCHGYPILSPMLNFVQESPSYFPCESRACLHASSELCWWGCNLVAPMLLYWGKSENVKRRRLP